MAALTDIVSYLDATLQCARYSDYCPNGLQLEGCAEVQRIVAGVTASQALIDAAIAAQADALLVHHGYFWRGENACITGMKRRRIAALLQNDISLLAYHLPLDCHPQLGNNQQFAERLGVALDPVPGGEVPPLLRTAQLERDVSGEEWAAHIEQALQRAPQHIAVDRPIRRIALCTGAAQGEIDTAIALGVDAYISGEISEQTVHSARENDIHYFAAGHHATERYGVQALAARLGEQFALHYEFIDCENPV